MEVSLLDPQPTRQDALSLIDRVGREGLGALCLPPTMFPLRGAAEGVRLTSVAGHPTGQHHSLIKASEAHMAVANGAVEVGVVLDPAHVFGGDDGTGDLNALISEIVTLREAVPYPAVLTVGAGSVGMAGRGAVEGDVPEEALRTLARAAVTAGADYVVAAVGAVEIMADAVSGTSVKVKSRSSVALCSLEDVAALRDAGADRVCVDASALTTIL